MTAIYEQFDKATARIGAYAIFKGKEYVGRVVFKYPRDGAGRLYCYVQVWGEQMVRAHAGGGGYDKRTAAFESAVARMTPGTEYPCEASAAHIEKLKSVMAGRDGARWNHRLESAGFTVACVAD